jgi:acyl-CoA reductase-like NAD-dependent aldehyde dehydrogenase
MDAVRVGNPFDPNTEMGPLISSAHRRRVQEYIGGAREEGARVLTCSEVEPVDDFNRGFWLRPTVLGDVNGTMRIAREEVFGPVLSVFRWNHLDEAIELANAVEYGLTAAVWTNDISRALTTAGKLQSGLVWINGVNSHERAVPFGGFKNSGVGRERGLEELYSYTEEKAIQIFLQG